MPRPLHALLTDAGRAEVVSGKQVIVGSFLPHYRHTASHAAQSTVAQHPTFVCPHGRQEQGQQRLLIRSIHLEAQGGRQAAG